MWAYLCGIVSAGVWPGHEWGLVLLGVVLAGPLVCGMSQAANDWCDRHVDAINEPMRPIPSGRIAGRWGLYIAILMLGLSGYAGWRMTRRASSVSVEDTARYAPITPAASPVAVAVAQEYYADTIEGSVGDSATMEPDKTAAG